MTDEERLAHLIELADAAKGLAKNLSVSLSVVELESDTSTLEYLLAHNARATYLLAEVIAHGALVIQTEIEDVSLAVQVQNP